MSTILIKAKMDHISKEQHEKILCFAKDYKVVITDEKETIEQLLPDAEILVGFVSRKLLKKAKKLKWYQQFGTGTEWLMKDPDISNADFILTNVSDNHCKAIAEHIFALLFSFSRRLPQSFLSQREGRWDQPKLDGDAMFEISEKTILLLGVGAIGSSVAKIAKALDMHVIGVRRHVERPGENIDTMVGVEQLNEMLPDADFVINSLPLTQATDQSIESVFFERMKPSAYFINIGRGQTVNEEALIQALQTQQIAGAGLDVFNEEPLPASSPLWKMKNVIITAHYAGGSSTFYERMLAVFIENLQRYLDNQPLRNVVDKKNGY